MHKKILWTALVLSAVIVSSAQFEPPGQKTVYVNVNFMLLEEILKQVSGRTGVHPESSSELGIQAAHKGAIRNPSTRVAAFAERRSEASSFAGPAVPGHQ
jgi:hypothetical protein